MKLDGKVAVVTGGAHGIGRALCLRFAAEGAQGVVVADKDDAAAEDVAGQISGLAVTTDVAREADIVRLVEQATKHFGPIDLFCSNAGIMVEGGVETSDDEWDRIFDINFKAHLYAARAVVPAMLERGGGYLLQVVSAAGLLTQIGSAPYSVTKHAALSLAEWLAVTYGDQGVTVSCVCPQGVRTRLLDESDSRFLKENALDPEDVADAVIAGLADERFLILPHPEVADYFRRKAADYDRWIRGMRRLQQSFREV